MMVPQGRRRLKHNVIDVQLLEVREMLKKIGEKIETRCYLHVEQCQSTKGRSERPIVKIHTAFVPIHEKLGEGCIDASKE
jgi:hypothetical protein